MLACHFLFFAGGDGAAAAAAAAAEVARGPGRPGGVALNSASSVGLESCAAALLTGACLRVLLPAGRSLHPGRANAGFIAGVIVAAAALTTLGALCWQTPYCDRRW